MDSVLKAGYPLFLFLFLFLLHERSSLIHACFNFLGSSMKDRVPISWISEQGYKTTTYR